jgi:N-acetylglutamate synthase-like GNAT family acetyltransferase
VPITVRLATAEDYDAIIPHVDTWWGGRNMATMLPRLFFQHFGPWTFVATRGDKLVGFLAALRSQTDPTQAYCHFIGVDPEERGNGIGLALYQRLFADAAASGCRQVLAVTSPLNRESIAFHRQLGFQPLPGPTSQDGIPYSPNYDGPGEDRVRLRKELSPSKKGRNSLQSD